MLTDLQLKKLPKMFALNDYNGDGVLAQEDYEESARILARIRGLAPGTSEYQDLLSTIMSWWQDLRTRVDADGDNRITLDEWLAYWDKVLATEGEYERIGKPFAEAVARMLDRDGDGKISSDEYTQWLTRRGLDANVALDCFARLDLNHDGHISPEEWVTAVSEYFQSDDPNAPGNWLFGPLDL